MLSHATPAGFVAHNESRGNYLEISLEMFADSRVDVIMGCGNPGFDTNGDPTDEGEYRYVGGEGVWRELLAGSTVLDSNEVEDADGDGTPDAWTVIQTPEEFEALAEAATATRVLGVPQVAKTLQKERDGDPENAGPYEAVSYTHLTLPTN